ncbi:MAG: DNA polymerase III subunit gamma/tau [Gallionella sp.]|nr:DNA polymerase III subunit gamma/tau [Gallionella sp.]
MSDTSVLARKWRPKNFAQLAGQEHVVRALGNALSQNRLHHAYLFTGTRGVGKTTIARIFAKSLNCLTGITATPCGECSACREIDSGRFVDLIELDAASNTQVDNMRELLESALYAPTSGRFKVYIIDEVHMLSKSAFNAMLKTLEEPPSHVKFILATTDPQKIPVTVLSRCLQFNLKQLPPALIATHLQYVLEQEKIEFEQGALSLVARAAQGSMRDALSLMDQAIAFSFGKIEEAAMRSMLGAIDQGYLLELLYALLAQNGAALLGVAETMATRSIAFESALQELASLLHRVALAQTVPQAIAEDEPERIRLLELAQAFTPEDVQLYYQIAIHGRAEIDLAPDEYAGFTMTLLRMLAFAPSREPMVARFAPQSVSAVTSQRALSVAVMPAAPAVVVGPSAAARMPVSVSQPDLPTDWGALLVHLNLQGMALQLAKHCVVDSLSQEQVVLRLAQEHKHLQTRMSVDNLQAALSNYFARPVKLSIVFGKMEVATPAKIEHQTRQVRQDTANDSIAGDVFVNEARAGLDARLVEESVKPLNN